jgi:ElaB/YqjD/DUF883 family membrane-anchored ribosome-binding protein
MRKQHHHIQESAADLAEDAQALLAATADAAESKVVEARKRLAAALERGKEAWGQVQEAAIEKAKAADEVIREHPYHSIALAFGIGALVGLLIGRRNR